ncbi:cation diffusion facilitator family transporter [Hyphomicrobium sp.]|uniref:cation diffusion facilitator family transporter n=1 Tax=Hyphomicrobium sp. TaxID=82 RepID=UPI000FB64E93|nr:cation diffusion facilitator family transporter [Hyphomicrobium sp.]RUO98569.1 MAG: cation transporter [Hyphomicrobium sp.]
MLDKVRDWFGFGDHEHDFGGQGHSHDHDGGHGHTHGVIDPTIATTERGIWAIKWAFVILAVTAALQILVVFATNSVALLADTIHNVGDATTAIPLWIAFRLAQRKPTATFTYGYGRVEDLAGIAIVGVILFSAIVAGYEAIDRIFHPYPISLLWWVAAAGVIGFLGNEIVAVFRIRVGREINSAALIADGYHARTDGLTSLAVVAGAFGVWLGFPLADPIIGLLITLAIFGIVWQSARAVLTRMLDGVDPGIIAEIRHSAAHVSGIKEVLDAKARWIGHRLHADVAVRVDDAATIADADKMAAQLRAELLAHIPAMAEAYVRVQGKADGPVYEAPQYHAPEPFVFKGKVAAGALEIIETADGERMRLTLKAPITGLSAEVHIARETGTEILRLVATKEATVLQSDAAPEEPHEFSAELRLASEGASDVLPFAMQEPEGHHH